MTDWLRIREILRQRGLSHSGDVLVWLQTAAGPQLATLQDVQGTVDLHLFVKANPEGHMWHNIAPPAPTDDARDAARYRYLRENSTFHSEKWRLEWYLPRRHGCDRSINEQFDDNIDDAIKIKEKGG